jgi:gamma-butyrobetaine dioxygenase/trimethyllysine dioxygenase
MDGEIQLFDGYLRVRLARGHGDFHLRWLRHNCDADRHPRTQERTACSSDLPDVLHVAHAAVSNGALEVTWQHDGRTSLYDLDWLDAHAYARDRREVPTPPADVGPLEIHAAGRGLGRAVVEVLARAEASGAAVVRRGPSEASPEQETESIIDAFSAAGLRVIGTHFGRVEDLRVDNTTNANTDQLGYTDAAIDPHTDQPFLDEPPRYQLLQSIRAADDGGASILVDGLSAARYLESVDAEAFERLCRTKVRFHRKQKNFERVVESSLLTLGSDEASTFRVRFSYFTMAPYDLPFADMEPWYRAHDRFARLVRDPRHQLRFTLEPGDFVLYDNHRMLHGRTGFRGARWMRGVYFDR